MRAPDRLTGLFVAALIALTAGCGDSGPLEPVPEDAVEFTFSLDEDMEGWTAAAIDTLDPAIDWHVRHADEVPDSDNAAVELYLENGNDQGKIWLERAFELEPGVPYQVDIEYRFATADWGDVNLFTVIAGVHPEAPRSEEELVFRDDTGNGADEQVGHLWQERSYRVSSVAAADGTLHVAIGVWGTWEATRRYFVDDVTVVFTPLRE